MRWRVAIGVAVVFALMLAPVVALRAAAPTVARGRTVAVSNVPAVLAPAPTGSADERTGASLPKGPIAVSADGDWLRTFAAPSLDGSPRVVPTANPWGERLSFPVVRRTHDAQGRAWLRILLGVAPNGAEGWVPADRVWPAPMHDRIVVDLSARRLRRWHDGRLQERLDVGIGAPSTPTTPGRFFVWARLDASADGPYGTFVLGLSGFPPTRSEASDGARIAIHGTTDPADLGQEVSHGCVRVLNTDMLALRDVPMGTPVLLRP